ncbi:type II CRISPR-associated endonuclease Cas1 [uncultured Ruminococcus sp.]|uniref:type II CRISPR-associated endonuclease Cas1 n=1 Tax=uncultured Ruminococcus sp. TaxID=165186 RepID=UPI0025CBBB96|nr:type II CRISPR-associated endonuclease Cas1 [uncultured Ruminococcus sp.]
MSWRTVVITKTSKLDYSMGYLVVRDVDSTAKIHISEISVLIVESTAVSVTAALLNEMISKKVKVIFCDDKHNPSFELTPYYGSHDCSLKLKRQISWNETVKQFVWTQIVAEKIKNQAAVLSYYGLEQSNQLLAYIDELELNDKTNREGHAAKVYFNALFGKSFSRNDDCPINAALNYGYSIILSVFNREIVASGYVTQLGLFHNNMFNQYNLSCDLMEPFRPFVDTVVKDMNPQKFEKKEKLQLYSLLNDELKIDGRIQTFINAIKVYCKSVFSAIEDNDTSLIRFASK